MYVNNYIATEKLKANHNTTSEGLTECACTITTNHILNYAREANTQERNNIPLMVIEQRDKLAYSLVVHGDTWLTEFLVNLQMNGISEIHRRAIKKTIKDEAPNIIQQAAEYYTKNDGELSPKDKATSNKVTALFTHLDEIKARLVADGEDEESVEEAILKVLERKFKGVMSGNA